MNDKKLKERKEGRPHIWDVPLWEVCLHSCIVTLSAMILGRQFNII